MQDDDGKGVALEKDSGKHTLLCKMRLLEHVRLSRAKMREGMSLCSTPRTSCASARRHPTHHRSALTDLRTSWCRHSGMHLLDHASTGMSIGMLTGSHWMTWRQARMLWDALMGRKRLRHHHVVVTKSPITGLLKVGERREGGGKE